MALTLDATVGGANSNSYVTQAEATAYFEGRFDATEWTGASSGDRDIALVMATSRLEQERYCGSRTSSDATQRLQWPRVGTYDLDGNLYDSNEIPRPLKEATFELTLALLKDKTLLADTGLAGFQNVRVGSLDVTPRAGEKGNDLPAIVRKLLVPLRVGGSHNARVVRA